MNLLPVSVLYSRNAELLRRMAGFLDAITTLRHVQEPGELTAVLHQYDPTLLFLDLQDDQWRNVLANARKQSPDTLLFAMGPRRSDPALEVAAMGICVLDDPAADRLQLQSIVSLAVTHLQSVREIRALKSGSMEAAARLADSAAAARPAPVPSAHPLQYFSRAFRNLNDVDTMLESIVEGIAGYAKVARVGVFAVGTGVDAFRLRAGIRCLDETRPIQLTPDDPLVRWLELHAHVIARMNMPLVRDPVERLLLEQALSLMGAEVIVPLHGRRRLIGWLFVGHSVTGMPYGAADLESLMVLGEHVSVTLENALLYEEVTVQKTLAETVLHAIPVGIVAVGADDMIRWYNRAAEAILGYPAEKALNQPARLLASRLAGLLASCIAEGPRQEPDEWMDPTTGRYLSVVTRPLMNGRQCLGAVAIINDLSKERLLLEKQTRLERTAFWSELAAAMSHEVRNPLVAISTFAQLLPERYGDIEFRTDFSQLVAREISRLTGMIDQISEFAMAREPSFRPVAMDAVLSRAVTVASQQHPSERTRVGLTVEDGLPRLESDADSLTEAFAHLIVNAIEAAEKCDSPVVTVTASKAAGAARPRLVVRIQDNGKGIPPDALEKVFSPFFSTKARGIGLGLPLAKRTVTDHNGQITMDSSTSGTTVTVVLPLTLKSPARG